MFYDNFVQKRQFWGFISRMSGSVLNMMNFTAILLFFG